MSHYMTGLAMQQAGLKPATKIVLYWLADHYNSETGHCFPSLKKLSEECEMDKATVVRHLAILEDAGLIERDKRTRENGSQTSTSYALRLVPPPVAKCDSPCRKMRQPPVAKCDSHNLVTSNLVTEPSLFGSDEPAISQQNDKIGIEEAFDRFWEVFPRKTAPGKARPSFKSALKKVKDPQIIIHGAKAYAELCAQKKTEMTYIAHPATWLNGERWTDADILPFRPSSTNPEAKRLMDEAAIERRLGNWDAAQALEARARAIGGGE